MPSRFFRSFGLAAGLLFLCGGAVLFGGCDGTDSKRASLYQRLAGTWTVERLEGGGFDYTNKLDERYPRGVDITFTDGDEGRTYEIVSPRSDDSTEVIAEGIVALPGDDVLQMASGFDRRVTWRYGFQTTSRATFEVQLGSRAFLRALFSGESRTPDLKMILASDDEE